MVSSADKIATYGRAIPQGMRQVDRVLRDVAFLHEIGMDIHPILVHRLTVSFRASSPHSVTP